jgi:hypothetical protein
MPRAKTRINTKLKQEITTDIKDEMKQGMDKLKQDITQEIKKELNISIKDEIQLGMEKLEKILKDKESSTNTNPPNTTNHNQVLQVQLIHNQVLHVPQMAYQWLISTNHHPIQLNQYTGTR